jgi:hypothetical protein
MKKINKIVNAALIFTLIGMFLYPCSGYPVTCNLRPNHSFSTDGKSETTERFNKAVSRIALGVIQKYFIDGRIFTLEQFLEKLDLEEDFRGCSIKTNGHRITDKAAWACLGVLESRLMIGVMRFIKPYSIFYMNRDNMQSLAKITPDKLIQKAMFREATGNGLLFKKYSSLRKPEQSKRSECYCLLSLLCSNPYLDKEVESSIAELHYDDISIFLAMRENLSEEIEQILVDDALLPNNGSLLRHISIVICNFNSKARIALFKAGSVKDRYNVARYADRLFEEEIDLIEKDESIAVTMWLADKKGITLKQEVYNKILYSKDVIPRILLIRSGRISDNNEWQSLLKSENKLVAAEAVKYAPLDSDGQLSIAREGTYFQKVKLSERKDLTDSAKNILKKSNGRYLNKVIRIREEHNIIIESGIMADIVEYVEKKTTPVKFDMFTLKELDVFKNIIENKEIFFFPTNINFFSKSQQFYGESESCNAMYCNEIGRIEFLNYEFSGKNLSPSDIFEIVIQHELYHNQFYGFSKDEIVKLAKLGGWYVLEGDKVMPPRNFGLSYLQDPKTKWAHLDAEGFFNFQQYDTENTDFQEYVVYNLVKISAYPKAYIDYEEDIPILLALIDIFKGRNKMQAVKEISRKLIPASQHRINSRSI